MVNPIALTVSIITYLVVIEAYQDIISTLKITDPLTQIVVSFIGPSIILVFGLFSD